MIEKIKSKVREWILTEEERELVSRVDDIGGRMDDIEGDWYGIQKALDDAAIYGEEVDSDDFNTLILAGRQNVVRDSQFAKPLYMGGRQNQLNNLSLVDNSD